MCSLLIGYMVQEYRPSRTKGSMYRPKPANRFLSLVTTNASRAAHSNAKRPHCGQSCSRIGLSMLQDSGSGAGIAGSATDGSVAYREVSAVDDILSADRVKELLDMRQALPKAERVRPSRQVLLSVHQATNGSGCPLQKAQLALIATIATRDVAAIELYRKLTGDELTEDRLLIREKNNVAKRRMSVGKDRDGRWRKCSAAMMKWLDARPACVEDDAERACKPGQWHPRKPGQWLSKVPPAPGSPAVTASNDRTTAAHASKPVSAGVPNQSQKPRPGCDGVVGVKEEKRNRTSSPNHYDATILSTPGRNASSPISPPHRSPISPPHRSPGRSCRHPSPTFASTTPRRSDEFSWEPSKGGPQKPMHGCQLKNPWRRPPPNSAEDIAWQAWTMTQYGRNEGLAPSELDDFVDERMGWLPDGTVVVQPPGVRVRASARSPPPRASFDGVWHAARGNERFDESQARAHEQEEDHIHLLRAAASSLRGRERLSPTQPDEPDWATAPAPIPPPTPLAAPGVWYAQRRAHTWNSPAADQAGLPSPTADQAGPPSPAADQAGLPYLEVNEDELSASLRPIFAELRLESALGPAVTWCRDNGADTLGELQSAGAEAVDELVQTLGLKKLKAVNLRKRLGALNRVLHLRAEADYVCASPC